MRIQIANGRLVDPANALDGRQDLYIADGRVVALGDPPVGFTADTVIDADGQVVCPGLVDLSARLREPGNEQKATIASESRAAVAAGVTTVCCPPDTNPVIDTPAVVQLIRQRAEAAAQSRVVVLGAMTKDLDGTTLSGMGALKEAGCVGVSNGLRPIANTQILRRAMEYAATFDLTVFFYPQDGWLAENGAMHEGMVSTRLGLPGIPQAAETVEVARCLALIEQSGVRTHFCRLSTARAVQMIARAQHDGLPVTADVAAHQLHLTEMDVAEFNTQCHVIPPLRTPRDCEALRRGVGRGTVCAICSDHQPHEPDAKLQPFTATAAGISALETLLPLSLRLVDDGLLSLPDLVARLSTTPARVLGVEGGALSVGSVADVCIFDPNAYWSLTPEQLVSRGHNTPFMHWELKGRVTHTLVGGQLVYQHPIER